MSFGIYLTGFVIVIAGLIYGANLMHVPTHWIVVCGLVLVGIGILTGVKVTRQKDSAT
jgi:cadmium resistance protein CadD (predicted permease)